jgi:hypothetical protein
MKGEPSQYEQQQHKWPDAVWTSMAMSNQINVSNSFFLLLYGENIRNFWRRSIIRSCDADVDDTPCSEFHFACWSINFAFQFVSSSSFQIFSIFQFEYFLVGGWAFSLTDDRLKMCAGPGLYWGMLNGCVTMETCITAVSYCHFFFFFFF